MIKTQKITSRDNPRLKHVRRVRDGKEKDSIHIEGTRLVEEALRSDLTVRECLIGSNALENERVKILAAAAVGNGVKIYEVSRDVFKSISDTENPQGILLICEKPKCDRKTFEADLRFSTEKIPVVVFLQEANNPSNLGAIFRTAEAAGAAGVMVSKNSADPFSPKSLRASMGSAFRLPIWIDIDLAKTAAWAHERNMIITGADVEGDKPYTQIDWKIPRLLVFGPEAQGLSDADKKKIEDLISIPMDSNVESLNLAVSAGVILFEAKRRMS